MNSFETLNNIDVSGKTEKKGRLTYLSWAWAWGELKKLFPDSFYTIYENKDGFNYHTDGRTCWVKTGVTLVDGDKQNEAIEYLPVMDNRNQSVKLDAVTSFIVNKTIQRSLTKAIARHGLGLYIYAGEDLPECEDDNGNMRKAERSQAATTSNQYKSSANSYKITEKQQKLVYARAKEAGLTVDQVKKGINKYFKIESVSELTKEQMDALLGMFENAKAK